MSTPSQEQPIVDFFKSLWKFFASIQLTVVVLLALALTSTIGTLIPQNEALEHYYRAYGDFLFRLFNVFDLFDMYHAWWFQMILILLAANITVCSIDRLSANWSIIFPRERHFNPERFRKTKINHRFDSTLTVDELKSLFSQILSKSFGYLKMEDTPGGFMIFAEKGRRTRLGVYAVHLSVLLLLVGGLIGSFFGFEAFATIPEGESIDSVQLRNSGETRKLPFTVRCDDFSLLLYPNGAPKEYRSSLTILEEGKPVLKKEIIVNDPLRYKNINFFQSSYGQMTPDSPHEAAPGSTQPPEKIVLNLTSSESKMSYQKAAVIGEPVDLPEGLGKLVIEKYLPDAQFGGQSIGPAFAMRLTEPQSAAKEIVVPLRFPNFDKMRKGKLIVSVSVPDQKQSGRKETPAATASPDNTRYYTGLQVTNDPGVIVVYLGFILMIAGCYIAFFASHQQVFLEVTGSKQKQRVFLSATSNKDKLGMKRTLSKLKEKLATSAVKEH